MSMWEFEDLTEQAVILVSRANASAQRKRELYANLYEVQEQFDCSYTHFRQRQALMDAEFFFRIDVKEHPAYPANRAYFDGLVAAGKNDWVKLPSDEGYSATYYSIGNKRYPEHDYEAGLYFDVRGGLWKDAVEADLLTGEAAEPFELWESDRFLAEVLTFAAAQPASDLRHAILKGYYGWAILGIQGIVAKAARDNPKLEAARDLPELREALAAPAPEESSWIDERLVPRREDVRYHEGDAAAVYEWLLDAYPPA